MFQAPDKIVNSGHRCGLVTGAKATGKTTFVVSGSKFAPDVLPAKELTECTDVVVVQVEAESVLGALDMGLRPRVIDLSGVVGWPALNVSLAKTIQFLRPLCESGDVRIVGIDLGAIDKEIRAYCAGMIVKPGQAFDVNTTFAAKEIDWNKVTAQAKGLYDALRTLPCLVVGMCHLKVTDNNPYVAKMDDEQKRKAELARDIQSMGGDAAKLGADLAKGTAGPWLHNASFMFAREVETKNVGTPLAPKLQSRYVTHTASNGIFEAGNRRASRLQPVETRTLRAILDDMYSF
jgi:hypothetical protein